MVSFTDGFNYHGTNFKRKQSVGMSWEIIREGTRGICGECWMAPEKRTKLEVGQIGDIKIFRGRFDKILPPRCVFPFLGK